MAKFIDIAYCITSCLVMGIFMLKNNTVTKFCYWY